MPPAEGLASRLFLAPALRTQPDRRLVTLVREGYEAAFEEIVRRYGRPLGRYAASIVGGRSEDVLQDAFAKALPALQRDEAEIDLRPWLFRIVRNAALNDLRDSPPTPELLAEALAGGRNPADELEQREELADLMKRLQALPEPQRAAIVMRELEGLGHEEIAAALGLTDGGARQAIYRARQALRDGAGMLLPLPLVRLLIDHGGEAVGAGAGAGGAFAAAGTSAGGAGAAGALKLGVVAVVVAGSVGAGVAVQNHKGSDAAEAQPVPTASSAPTGHHRFSSAKLADTTLSSAPAESGRRERGADDPDSGSDDSSHHGSSGSTVGGSDDVNGQHGGSSDGPSSAADHRGPRDQHGESRGDDFNRHGGGPGPGGSSGSSSGGGDGDRGGETGSGEGGSTDGSGSGGPGPSEGSCPDSGGSSDSGDALEATPPPPRESSTSGDSGSGSSGGSDGSGGSGDGSSTYNDSGDSGPGGDGRG